MRPVVHAVLVTLVVSLGVIAAAEEGWAAPFAGGSRLIFYYTTRSIVNPAGALGSAATLVSVTNQDMFSAVDVNVIVWNGTTCLGVSLGAISLSPRETLRLNVAGAAASVSSLEGWVDVFAVNAAGTPIRWDKLSGKGTILDFGGTSTAAATYEAAALFSDAPRTSTIALEAAQGTPIVSNTSLNTFGAVVGMGDFWASGGPFGTTHRLVVIPISTVPGTAPVASSHPMTWKKTDATTTQSAPVASSCMIAASLASLHPGFAAAYPNTVSVFDGGNLTIGTDLANKGFVGALFETATTPSVLVVHPIQQSIGPTLQSHE